jgi:hypothetical protein
MRQEGMLLPDTKKQLKIRSFHPLEEYTTTSEVLDLAIIELVEGFQLSKEVSMNILNRIDLQNKEFSVHSMAIYLSIIWEIK